MVPIIKVTSRILVSEKWGERYFSAAFCFRKLVTVVSPREGEFECPQRNVAYEMGPHEGHISASQLPVIWFYNQICS